MHPGAQTGIANELMWSVKSRDVADSRQQQHGIVHANPWQLHQESRLVSPRRKAALAYQFGLDLVDQRLEAVQNAQVVPHA